MAVKKHKLVANNHSQLDLESLARFFMQIKAQPSYLPQSTNRIKYCTDIIQCLARSKLPDDEEGQALLLAKLQPVEDFLRNVISALRPTVCYRHKLVTAVLFVFYQIISNPESEASAATCIVLNVIADCNEESTMSAARFLIEMSESRRISNDAGLRCSLATLYRWVSEWNCTPNLSNWVLTFIKALQEKEYIDILVDVSMDNIDRLFDALLSSENVRQYVAPVVLHILASMRESPEVLEKISPKVRVVLDSLASDSGQWSRQVLQNLVDVITHLVKEQSGSLTTPELLAEFNKKNAKVISCLERHMASRGSRYLTLTPWRVEEEVYVFSSPLQVKRLGVGLVNHGNTCYMNSVIQALLMTRQFSTYVILKKLDYPFWTAIGSLFAKMFYCASPSLDPYEHLKILKPIYFAGDKQHDSSEFLGYLLELLRCNENSDDKTASPSPTDKALPIATKIESSSDMDTDNEDTSVISRQLVYANTRKAKTSNCTDQPGSSKAVKRSLSSEDQRVFKRSRGNESQRKDSIIQALFGGILVTRIQCNDCKSSSLSRDEFRDLQLAFPEKPEKDIHTVQTLLEFYCSNERLSGENRYMCRDCGRLREAERSVLIEVPPKFLILVLKHFKYDPKKKSLMKLMNKIHYNESVVLPTVRSQQEPSNYILYAAVIHSGMSIDSGHYYTIARDTTDQWLTYNDTHVEINHQSTINRLSDVCTPYILFYRRVDVIEPSIPTEIELPPEILETLRRARRSRAVRVTRSSKRKATEVDSTTN